MRNPYSILLIVAYLTIGISGCAKPKVTELAGANRVEVFRVGSNELEPPTDEPAPEKIIWYPILATGEEQGPDFAARLTKVLRSDGVTQNRKKCGLEPGVAFRLWSGERAVEVLICFNCDVLWVHEVGVALGENPHYEWQDFDPVRSELLALAKEAFPDDREIQDLPEKRH
ncbi:MAG: hypothetical protein JWM11_7989 [Planctomycetaceae bacterium]|nr:hypothetical protein [Planctomycetaceae bacterium]